MHVAGRLRSERERQPGKVLRYARKTRGDTSRLRYPRLLNCSKRFRIVGRDSVSLMSGSEFVPVESDTGAGHIRRNGQMIFDDKRACGVAIDWEAVNFQPS